MRDATIDMWETMFILLSLFAVIVTAMSSYFVWLLALALGIQLFDFVSTPDRWIDFIILVLLALVALPALGIYTVLAPYESWLLFFALLAQLYDDYTS
jgi:membrane protein YdbS with pleckstrin-like domain